MHKTPDEIKKGLECCKLHDDYDDADCSQCPYTRTTGKCVFVMHDDALAYIQQLEEKYKHAMENAKILSDAVTKLERERDFLLKYLTDSTFAFCDICKHDIDGSGTMGCKHIREHGVPCFEWKGLPEDVT